VQVRYHKLNFTNFKNTNFSSIKIKIVNHHVNQKRFVCFIDLGLGGGEAWEEWGDKDKKRGGWGKVDGGKWGSEKEKRGIVGEKEKGVRGKKRTGRKGIGLESICWAGGHALLGKCEVSKKKKKWRDEEKKEKQREKEEKRKRKGREKEEKRKRKGREKEEKRKRKGREKEENRKRIGRE
jgi:hypothetical protein